MLAIWSEGLLKAHTRKTPRQWGSNMESLDRGSKLFANWAILANRSKRQKWVTLGVTNTKLDLEPAEFILKGLNLQYVTHDIMQIETKIANTIEFKMRMLL